MTNTETTSQEPAGERAEDEALESRLRGRATQQGLQVVKSRSRDPRALDYGMFMIVDLATKSAVAGELGTANALSLAEVEQYLTRRP